MHPAARRGGAVLIALTAVAAALLLALAGCGALVSKPVVIHASGSTTVGQPYATPAAGQTFYSDPLTSAAPGWANAPQCVFTAAGLSVRPGDGLGTICLAPVTPPADLAVTVTAQQVSGPLTHGYGIAFRHAAPKSYYFFGIDGQGRFTLSVVVGDVSHIVIPFTHSSAIHTGAGATNTLQVVAQGQLVTMLVNGAPVGQATLSTFSGGQVGLRGINDGSVLFSQLSIAHL